MNSTITLPEIAEALASTAGVDSDKATRFVVQLFSAVEAWLAASRKANIPGIGTFSATEDGLVFVPDTSLASAINAPFAIFAPVELSAEDARRFEVEEDTVAEAAVHTEAPREIREVLPPVYVPEEEPATSTEPAPVSISEPANEESIPEVEPQQPDAAQQPQITENPENDTVATLPEPQIIYVARRNPWPWVVALIALVAGFAGGYCLGNYSSAATAAATEPVEAKELPATTSTDSVPYAAEAASQVVAQDTVAVQESPAVAAEVKKEPVYDTVGTSRYLTTIARDHYGRKDYWVFIYETNAARLKSPNLISPGTRVEIPYLGEHPALNPDLRARARKLAAEYAERYNL
ncbi:MAG: hypothetical protein K2L21_07300 [Muribaculaceae bacterium]|nr:hypothetical protein [Muribaculaceae bacterium]